MGDLDQAPVGDDWQARFELLADPLRLALVTAIHEKAGRSVGELAEITGATPTATSQALRILRERELVRAEVDGRRRRYHLADPDVHALLHAIGAPHAPDHH